MFSHKRLVTRQDLHDLRAIAQVVVDDVAGVKAAEPCQVTPVATDGFESSGDDVSTDDVGVVAIDLGGLGATVGRRTDNLVLRVLSGSHALTCLAVLGAQLNGRTTADGVGVCPEHLCHAGVLLSQRPC